MADEPIVAVIIVPPAGNGTFESCESEGAPGRTEGGGRFGTPAGGSYGVQATPEGPTTTVTVLLWALTIVVVIVAVTEANWV